MSKVKLNVYLLLLVLSLTAVNAIAPCADELREVKVAVLYERLGDGSWMGRSLEDEVKVIKALKPDMIFRAFWRWTPCPENCDQLPGGRLRRMCQLRGYSYQRFEEAIRALKAEMPEVIICGAVPAQIVTRRFVWNPKTGEVIRYPDTWKLALDPAKWGIESISKEELQCKFAKTHAWVPEDLSCDEYSPEMAFAYFPDMTNPRFQDLLVSWAERQVDAGADCIWIDMLFKQAYIMIRITGDPSHPAIRDTYNAMRKVVDRIREYGREVGRCVYVGSWAPKELYGYQPPALDFLTVSPRPGEVSEMRLDRQTWEEALNRIREIYGDAPIFAFIDWAGDTRTPLGRFSQQLTPEQQRGFIRIADEVFSELGVTFIYPLHGGYMGRDARRLSYGVSKVYDSLAPEFRTYETILELARAKRAAKRANERPKR